MVASQEMFVGVAAADIDADAFPEAEDAVGGGRRLLHLGGVCFDWPVPNPIDTTTQMESISDVCLVFLLAGILFLLLRAWMSGRQPTPSPKSRLVRDKLFMPHGMKKDFAVLQGLDPRAFVQYCIDPQAPPYPEFDSIIAAFYEKSEEERWRLFGKSPPEPTVRDELSAKLMDETIPMRDRAILLVDNMPSWEEPLEAVHSDGSRRCRCRECMIGAYIRTLEFARSPGARKLFE